MLFLIFFEYNFFLNLQSGFYMDFFLKKCVEAFIRNFFIYTALFFGEKYMIEVLTKKIFENYINSLNSVFGWTNYNYMWFFLSVLCFIVYLLSLLNLVVFFY